ncbi:MAG: hypothetical protein UV80_C0003G0097 [Candidatus Peregrinibacteria bacterium GW2011_GWF2_43_17]|nr:MAG: hypothetical protein UV80_C0003G0097 [Candidatus Peregrinibacteria bacterium GW2011_GWF2_43_17]KKT18750.1 MAG: hypothetical protein UW03_C0032G0014 [Candidatus Peregrinibacteria bacterium GW2011_GWA2_43_8]HAU39511.1 hypothetical protein [Candidatus Peregrinibacteria bacterium]
MLKKQNLFLWIVATVVLIVIGTLLLPILPFIYAAMPLTKIEARSILEDSVNPIHISSAINYFMESESNDIGNINLIIHYLDCSWDYSAIGYYRKYGSEHNDKIISLANEALEQATGLDLGYDEELDCESETNQKAIEAWYDWYENEDR